MADLAHVFGSDLSLSPSGDLLTTATPAQATEQRVLRRLLTNPGGYIFHRQYGAGLPAMVGNPASAARLQALIARHMAREAGVGADPPPSSTVTSTPDGTFTATISYADQTGAPQQIAVTP